MQSYSRRTLLTAGLALAACGRRRTPGFNGYAFVAAHDSRSVAVIDLIDFTVKQRIPLSAAPSLLLADPERPVIYALTAENGTVHEIDSAQWKVTRGVRAGDSAAQLRMAPDGSLWALCHSPKRLVKIDSRSLSVQGYVTLPLPPVDFDLEPHFGHAAVSYGPAGSVQLLDLKRMAGGALTDIGGEAGILRMRSDGKAVLAANPGRKALTVLEAPSGKVMAHLPLPVRPDHFCFNRNQGQMYITGQGMDAVVVVYPHYVPQVAETVLAGHAPGAMAAGPELLFIANPVSGDVSIMQMDPNRVIAVAAAGAGPSEITVTPDDNFALVLNQGSGDMAVIRIAGVKPTSRNKSAGLFTMVPIGSKPVSVVVQRA